jgi:hypothetical protein
MCCICDIAITQVEGAQPRPTVERSSRSSRPRVRVATAAEGIGDRLAAPRMVWRGKRIEVAQTATGNLARKGDRARCARDHGLS